VGGAVGGVVGVVASPCSSSSSMLSKSPVCSVPATVGVFQYSHHIKKYLAILLAEFMFLQLPFCSNSAGKRLSNSMTEKFIWTVAAFCQMMLSYCDALRRPFVYFPVQT